MSCHVCEAVASADHERVVYDRAGWLGYQLAEVPGWITLAPRQHVEGPDGLDDEQASAFGRALRDLARAVVQVTGATRAHVVYLGETARHFHASVFPRLAGEPALFGSEQLIAEIEAGADPERAQACRAAIRAAMER